MYDNFGLYSCKNCLDPLKSDDTRVKSFRDNLYNSHKLWKIFNVNSYNKKLYKVGQKIINNKKIDILQIPILDSDLDYNSIKWLLSFELNDIIRIMIQNSIKFDDQCNIIRTGSFISSNLV